MSYITAKKACELLTWTFLVAVSGRAATTVSAIQGTVLDDSGKPVVGARVMISEALPSNAPHFAAPPVITGRLAATGITGSKVFSPSPVYLRASTLPAPR